MKKEIDDFKKELNAIKNSFLADIRKGLDDIQNNFLERLNSDLHEIKDKQKHITLEQLAYLIHKTGQEYAEFKQVADRYDELKKHLISTKKVWHFQDANEKGKSLPDTRAETLALADADYKQHIFDMLDARKRADKAKIRFEAYQNLFDAKRTMEVSNRELNKRGLYDYTSGNPEDRN